MQLEPWRLPFRTLLPHPADPRRPRTRLPGAGPGEQTASRSLQQHGAPRWLGWKPHHCGGAVARAFRTAALSSQGSIPVHAAHIRDRLGREPAGWLDDQGSTVVTWACRYGLQLLLWRKRG
jgi:hypothetical protein